MASNIPGYKTLASAQITITDQTDASVLAGNMSVVSGSKQQIYLTGGSEPHSPSWKINKLVLRPFLTASGVYRGSSSDKYNPNLFDPWEYPDLTSPGDAGVTTAYIRDIEWYLIDSAGNEKLINAEEDNRFSHSWEYTKGEEKKVINDKRQLVIQDNILKKDSSASIMIKFSFHDPFANINIPQQYSTELTCLSTGIGTSKTNIVSVNGTSFYNGDPKYLLLIAEYFVDGEKRELQNEIETPGGTTSLKWFIRSQSKDGWALLDPETQDDNIWNQPGQQKLYELHRVDTVDPSGKYTTSKSKNPKGAIALYVYNDLIAGSDVVKAEVTDGVEGRNYSAIELLYDYSDPVQCTITSSNGDKLFKGMETVSTVLKAIVTYNGNILEDGAPEYGEAGNTNDRIFDFYWYKTDLMNHKVYNVWMEEKDLKMKCTEDEDYTAENGYPKKGTRTITVSPNNIDSKAIFTVDILNKQAVAAEAKRNAMYKELLTEEVLKEATIANQNIGIPASDIDAQLATAKELKALYDLEK